MEQPVLDSLASFCAEQRQTFESSAWLTHGDADRRTLAVIAKYLSMTSWYGHEDELVNIASEIHPAIADEAGFHLESQAIGFDLKHFSSRVRYRIALSKVTDPIARN
jgi:hypothetical protein